MVPQNDHRISLSHAEAGSLLTTEPYRGLHIQHAYGEHQHTSSNTLTPTINATTPTHKVLTNFALNLTQPMPGADRPSGPQACATAIQT